MYYTSQRQKYKSQKYNMLPGLGKPVLSTRKILPDFESLKCNNFLSVICIVSKMSSCMQKSMRNSIQLTAVWYHI